MLDLSAVTNPQPRAPAPSSAFSIFHSSFPTPSSAPFSVFHFPFSISPPTPSSAPFSILHREFSCFSLGSLSPSGHAELQGGSAPAGAVPGKFPEAPSSLISYHGSIQRETLSLGESFLPCGPWNKGTFLPPARGDTGAVPGVAFPCRGGMEELLPKILLRSLLQLFILLIFTDFIHFYLFISFLFNCTLGWRHDFLGMELPWAAGW